MSDRPPYSRDENDPFLADFQDDSQVQDHFSNRRGGMQDGDGTVELTDGSAVFVLGILSIIGGFCSYGVLGFIFGFVALMLAAKPWQAYHANPHRYTPHSFNQLKNGRICAIIGLSISAAFLVFVFLGLLVSAYAL